MNAKTEKAIGLLQIILIIFLISALVGLFGYYAYLQVNGTSSQLLYFPDSEKSIFSSESDIKAAKKNSSFIIPEFVGFSIDGRKYSCGFDDTKRNSVIDRVKAVFSMILSENTEPKILKFANESEKTYYLENLYDEKNYVFLSFYSDLPADVMSPILTGGESDFAFVFKTIFMAENGSNSKAVLCDTDGNIHQFDFDGTNFFNMEEFTAYIDTAGSIPFELVSAERNVPCALMTKSCTVPNITGSVKELSKQDKDTVLKTFMLNPDSSNIYESADGSVTYIENTNEITFYPNNVIEYTSYGNENDLNEISEYYPVDGIFNFADYVSSAYNIINLFDTELFGGEARVGLVSADFENSVLTFGFKYFIAGAAIESENGENDIVISLHKGSLKYLKARFIKFEYSSDYTSLIPQKLSYQLVNDDYKRDFAGFCAVYSDMEISESKEKYFCKWLYKTKAD